MEVEASLRSSNIIQDLDIHCLRDHRPSNSIFIDLNMLTQRTTAKESCPKEFRLKEANLVDKKASASPWTNMAESLEQGKKMKKNKK